MTRRIASGPERAGHVALVGWTNVGKSTLLNALVGSKLAAVADVAQTTRQRITGVVNLPGRGQIILVDTPGLHRPRYRMNRAMIEIVTRAVASVDLAVLVVDATCGLGPGDREAAGLLKKSLRSRILALNKVDLVRPKTKLLPLIEQGSRELGIDEVVPLSARTGDGCDDLLEVMLGALPVSPPLFPPEYLTDQPERVLAAEYVREKLIEETREELPHATAVVCRRWNETDDGWVEIEATILVDRESQKGIVIGRGGERLKRVGTAARIEIEALVERRVVLKLWVQVRKDWRNNERVLEELGLL